MAELCFEYQLLSFAGQHSCTSGRHQKNSNTDDNPNAQILHDAESTPWLSPLPICQPDTTKPTLPDTPAVCLHTFPHDWTRRPPYHCRPDTTHAPFPLLL